MTTQNLSEVRIIIESAFYFVYCTVNVAFVEKKNPCDFVLVDGVLYVSALKQGCITILI